MPRWRPKKIPDRRRRIGIPIEKDPSKVKPVKVREEEKAEVLAEHPCGKEEMTLGTKSGKIRFNIHHTLRLKKWAKRRKPTIQHIIKVSFLNI